jgi:hypothetical protein
MNQVLGLAMKIRMNKAKKTISKLLDSLAKGQYDPLIKVWNGPKGTRRHLFRGVKDGLNHQFLSDGEKRLGVYRESLPQTLAFYEQYPLWDIERCIRIAHEMGMRYPMDEHNEAYLLSTDLFCLEVDPETGKQVRVARTYKPIASFLKESNHPVSIARTLAKLELERRYYEEIETNFHIETDLFVSKVCEKNLLWAREPVRFIAQLFEHQIAFNYSLVDSVIGNPDEVLRYHIENAALKTGINHSDAFALTQWGIWTHQIPVNLDAEINVFRPLVLSEFQ